MGKEKFTRVKVVGKVRREDEVEVKGVKPPVPWSFSEQRKETPKCFDFFQFDVLFLGRR